MKKHLNELQVYSGIAILFVTLIHSNGYYLVSILNLRKYIDAGILMNLFDKIIHIAVPMFIFIAGYKYEMNDKEKSSKELFIKIYKQIIRPFFSIAIFFILYKCSNEIIKRIIYHMHIDIIYYARRVIGDFAKLLIGHNYAYQLWYIPMYIFVKVIYHIIHKQFKNSKVRLMIFIILALVWVTLKNLNIEVINNNNEPFNYIYYFYLYELGCIFYDKKLNLRNGNFIIEIYIVMLLGISLINNVIISNILNDVVLIPIGVIAFYYISLKIKNSKILLILGKYSFIIFLFHEPIFLSGTAFLMKKLGLYKSWFIVPVVASLSIIFSIYFYKVLVKSNLAEFVIDSNIK